MKTAFAGFRHGHIFVLYDAIKAHPDFEIVGACEPDENSRKTAQERGVRFCYESYDKLFADSNVELVVVGDCYGSRGSLVIEALKHGKHVIADKPLCTKLSELDEIERLSKEKNLTVSCMFTMRFEDKINSVKELIDSGELGEINNVYFGGQHPLQYGRRPSWYFEEGKHGGVINDIAIHGVDLLSYLLGDSIDKISGARCWNKYAKAEPEFLDSAQFMATTKNGGGVIADVSYAIPDGVEFNLPYYWQFNLWGTKGVISFSLNEKDSVYYIKNNNNAQSLKQVPAKTDYLTDFLRTVKGEKDVILPSYEVFSSTRQTLKLQEFSENQK